MPRRKLDVTKHTFNLRTGDVDFLRNFCRDLDIEASDIIRNQIAKVVDAIKARQAAAVSPANIEVELELEED